MTESDAVKGSMCWCPITNLDIADEACEWNMGNTRGGLTEENRAYSDGMAPAFADHINQPGLTDEEGNVLTLVESEEGICRNGSYHDYVMGVIEASPEHFLSDTEFPYTASSSGGLGGRMGGRGGMGGNFGGGKPDGSTGGQADDRIPDQRTRSLLAYPHRH